jgi:hypothetical protein
LQATTLRWFLHALRDYCALAPEGAAVLRARVRRRFPSDRADDYDFSAPGGRALPRVSYRFLVPTAYSETGGDERT